MKHETAHGYSIWAVPEGRPASLAREVIDSIAHRNNLMAFEPHVTLMGSIQCSEEEVLARADSLARMLNPIKIEFSSISHSDRYFKCVFIRAKKTEQMDEVHESASFVFEREQKKNGFDPHMSLAYGSMDSKERLSVINGMDRGTVNAIKSFDARRIDVYSTEGLVRDWYKVKGFGLGSAD